MTDRLDLPDELKHLLEKREGERRADESAEGTAGQQPPAGEERRQGDRRADDK